MHPNLEEVSWLVLEQRFNKPLVRTSLGVQGHASNLDCAHELGG